MRYATEVARPALGKPAKRLGRSPCSAPLSTASGSCSPSSAAPPIGSRPT
ncbi:hypothetical protein ACWD4T_32600 [Streptomyces umbrinus]